ncbi:hypothetical protein [Sphaerisporangium aureirubrum]|uniref:Uncharacterized protein n=1 Tax=Sphaerisporangium aureirubrum TaxID=1544736 RepID=A0ABW1NCE4_9ACTN
MRDPRQAVNKIRDAADDADFSTVTYEGDHRVALELERGDVKITVDFVVRNLATSYACFHHAEIHRAQESEPGTTWAMRDLLTLIAAEARPQLNRLADPRP